MVALILFEKKHSTKTNRIQNQPSTKFFGDHIGTNIDAFKEGENNTALNKVHTAHGGAPHATPWARATKNVKKPQDHMCESWRKA